MVAKQVNLLALGLPPTASQLNCSKLARECVEQFPHFLRITGDENKVLTGGAAFSHVLTILEKLVQTKKTAGAPQSMLSILEQFKWLSTSEQLPRATAILKAIKGEAGPPAKKVKLEAKAGAAAGADTGGASSSGGWGEPGEVGAR